MRFNSLAMAASAIVCGTLLLGSTPARAQDCGDTLYGAPAEGRIFQRLIVETRAKANWREKVRAYNSRHRRQYSTSWSAAQNKNIDCKKRAPGRLWVCTARARPCRGG